MGSIVRETGIFSEQILNYYFKPRFALTTPMPTALLSYEQLKYNVEYNLQYIYIL